MRVDGVTVKATVGRRACLGDDRAAAVWAPGRRLDATESPDVNHLLRRHKATYTIFEGTSEIQRLIISRAISGVHIR